KEHRSEVGPWRVGSVLDVAYWNRDWRIDDARDCSEIRVGRRVGKQRSAVIVRQLLRCAEGGDVGPNGIIVIRRPENDLIHVVGAAGNRLLYRVSRTQPETPNWRLVCGLLLSNLGPQPGNRFCPCTVRAKGVRICRNRCPRSKKRRLATGCGWVIGDAIQRYT